jgi:hypothetical protein
MAWLPLPPHLPWRLIGASAGAVALAVALFFAGAYFMAGDGGVSAVEARLARAEQQLLELSGRAPPPAVDTKAMDDLAGRVAKLEAAVTGSRPAAIDPTLLNRIAAVEGVLKALDEKVGIVARRTDDISVIARDAREKADTTATALAELSQKVTRLGTGRPADFDALADRTGAIERNVAALAGELAKRGVGDTGDRAVRLAMVAAALNVAAERGDAFGAELAAAKSLGADPKTLAPLEPFMTTGVPAAASLGRELVGLMPALAQAAGTVPREASFLDRMQANAERLVRIRPIDDAPGDDPAAVLARIELRAAQADLASALAELAKLPAHARAPAQAWIAKAEARIAAIKASRQVAAESLAALGKAP